MPETRLQRACCPTGQNEQAGHEHLQTKPVHGNDTGEISAPPIVNEVLQSSGQPLDVATRAFMEPRFGHDFSHVRVHADAQAAESARAVNALAYTLGRHVVFGAGQYAPTTQEGQRLMAHELMHVVQQTAGTGGPDGTILPFANSVQRKEDASTDNASTAFTPVGPGTAGKFPCKECIIAEPPFQSQPRMMCWAAAATMIVNTHDPPKTVKVAAPPFHFKFNLLPYSIRDVLRKADGGGPYYINTYGGIPSIPITDSDFVKFVGALKMKSLKKSLTPAEICGLLSKHGPLGVVINQGGTINHAIVVYGIGFDAGDCQVIHQDPAVGAQRAMTFANFDAVYGAAASGSINLFYY
jgi:hypothetical protein